MSAFKVAMFNVLESWCVSSETEDLNRAMIVRNRYQKMGGQKRVRVMWELCVLESKLDIERKLSEWERERLCVCLFVYLPWRVFTLSMCVFYSLRIENVLQRDREMVEKQGKRKMNWTKKKLFCLLTWTATYQNNKAIFTAEIAMCADLGLHYSRLTANRS